jgi:hypothetical protein
MVNPTAGNTYGLGNQVGKLPTIVTCQLSVKSNTDSRARGVRYECSIGPNREFIGNMFRQRSSMLAGRNYTKTRGGQAFSSDGPIMLAYLTQDYISYDS